MKLELAVVSACSKTGCAVTLVKDNLPVETQFSSLVKKFSIIIRPEQLVAVDMAVNPPEIIWRWNRAVVLETTPDIVVADDARDHPAQVSPVPNLPLTLTVDDEVFTCSTGYDYEVHDIILDGKPTHPDRLLKHITPRINEVYQQ